MTGVYSTVYHRRDSTRHGLRPRRQVLIQHLVLVGFERPYLLQLSVYTVGAFETVLSERSLCPSPVVKGAVEPVFSHLSILSLNGVLSDKGLSSYAFLKY